MRVGSALACCVLCLAVVADGDAMQRVEQQTFVLPSDGTVKIDTYRGAINVMPGQGSQVRVTVRLQTNQKNEAKARRDLDALQLSMQQEGKEIVVKARNPRETGLLFVWNDPGRLALEFEITVPTHCNLDLRTGDGGIEVGSLSGHMVARTETGTIFFRRIEGSVDAQAQTGDVVVSRCIGPVTLKTVRGSVRTGLVSGRAVLESVNGDIEVQTALNAVQASTQDGNITAGFAAVGGASRVKTLVGNINATVNPDVACSIHASSLWGKVFSKLPMEAESGGDGRSHLAGEFNGGGPVISLDASGGYVKIATAKPLFAE